MMRIMLKSKISYAVVTEAELYYQGSITLDELLIEEAGLLVGEKVEVLNVNNGQRFETYVIKGKRASGVVCLNGPAARLGQPRDKLIILSYGIYTESEIENIITAKAAIFAAMKILLQRLDVTFSDLEHFYIAGAFGNYIDVDSAVTIGLIPNLPKEKVSFVGNTSIEGAKLAALYKEAFYDLEKIRENTTYYDLMGAEDYVEEFQKALFLPHTDIQLFQEVF